MNNFKKIGLTALAGSLVAISAQAGEMSVSGSFNATYSTESGNAGTANANMLATGDHGVGIGNDKDVNFSGSGELDNGWTFSGNTLMKDSFDVSSSALSITMGSMGTISTGSQTGGTSTKYDVQTPKAYEEIDDGGALSLSANYVGNYLDNNSIYYTSPAFDLGDITATLDYEYSPEASGTSPADGGVQSSATWGSGQSLGLTLSGHGATFGIYGAERKTDSQTVGVRDAFAGVAYINYSFGPVSVGYSESYHDDGLQGAAAGANTDKLVGTATGIFESNTYSIAFNVNDNLSVSYAKAEDTFDAQSTGGEGTTTATADVTMDMKSIQAAYSMGAMSIKAYRTETDNVNYATNGGSSTTTEIAVGLAF
jgi:outer membrane protein OmpU